jgi:hypothetical protein
MFENLNKIKGFWLKKGCKEKRQNNIGHKPQVPLVGLVP